MGETEQRPTAGSRLGAQENAGISTLEHGQKPPMTPPGKLVSIKIQMLDDTQETFDIPVRMGRLGWLQVVQAFLIMHTLKPVPWLMNSRKWLLCLSALNRWWCSRIALNSEASCRLILFQFEQLQERLKSLGFFLQILHTFDQSGYLLNSCISLLLIRSWSSKL